MVSVAKNIERVQSELERLGIPPSSITILAAVKSQPYELVAEAVDCGLTVLGNNYVQEGQNLIAKLAHRKIFWHFIGHIQSRKVKDLLDYDCVQSLDRIEVAQRMDERLKTLNKKLDVLVEINCANEPQKSGVRIEELDEFMALLQPCENLSVRGFMTLPPPLFPVEQRAPYFKKVRELFEKYQKQFSLNCLSMGTSDDFGLAALHGATLLRLGTALFGARPIRQELA